MSRLCWEPAEQKIIQRGKKVVQRFILNRKEKYENGFRLGLLESCVGISLFTLSSKARARATTTCGQRRCCRVRFIPLKRHRRNPSVFFSRATLFWPFFCERVGASPVCCWFYFLKKKLARLDDASHNRFFTHLKDASRSGFWRTNLQCSSRTQTGNWGCRRLHMKKCYNFYFFVQLQFFLSVFRPSSRWKKLKMHKTGIEWEKVEDPFNRSLNEGKLFFWFVNHFFWLSSRNAFELQFSWSEKRGRIQEHRWDGEMSCGNFRVRLLLEQFHLPMTIQRRIVHKTSHLSSSWH